MYVALLANRPGRNQDSLNFHIKSSSISWSGFFLSFCCWCERAVSQLSSPWSLTPLTVITLFQVFSAVTELQSKNGGERGVQHTFMASVWSMWAHYDHQFGTTKRKKHIEMMEKSVWLVLSVCRDCCGLSVEKSCVIFFTCDANKQVKRWPLFIVDLYLSELPWWQCVCRSASVAR